ncbi:cytochrome c oxidase subunit VB-domain-containing protein [Baffinella frigidus]|nr:cytochrome c oxidase subunit VB-domain-containing protein [Cryptophyta sp. CCMP2293]|mmetsp:Transcript_24716/g.58824  ORF Transcript_24716/g.58824 Transcript_24716/m.58824 type:complete len:154 (-) Transcript_24716:167-628(-)|eukprot:CAMPEP_0180124152 /NCGR_PEP_ID=MMETSP0986-20121125/4496_1 /TAXON_ID=697907 /ORGANISM="non described non described, Strain CCMP2293" /LENGTH=153 /DNA_ID=CAMNT_0022063467 /DNA_START=26 /DNA_END=487 /DNA_ORIENTATION=-
MAARALSRPFAALAKQISRPTRVAAVFPQRFMSDRVPIPEAKWKQNPDLDNVVPSNFDQATGLERAEMLAEMEGRSIFEEAPIGPFGTAENPVMVESIFEERIMGCPGDCGGGDTRNNNNVRWFVISAAKPYVCPTCSQVFALQKIAGETYNF